MDNNPVVDYLTLRLQALGYEVRGSAHIPQNGMAEKILVYIAGHHTKLTAYGHIRLMEGLWHNPETEITVLPPEVFFG